MIMTIIEGQDQQQSSLGSESQEPGSARDVVSGMVEAGLLDDLMGRVDDGSLRLTGEGGFLPEMVKAVLERDLSAIGRDRAHTILARSA
ncbi:hypothetical protein ABIB14_003251 [Arthrobacter sp. UYEF3]